MLKIEGWSSAFEEAQNAFCGVRSPRRKEITGTGPCGAASSSSLEWRIRRARDVCYMWRRSEGHRPRLPKDATRASMLKRYMYTCTTIVPELDSWFLAGWGSKHRSRRGFEMQGSGMGSLGRVLERRTDDGLVLIINGLTQWEIRHGTVLLKIVETRSTPNVLECWVCER